VQQSVPGRANRLPPRYELEWGTEFWELVNRALFPGASILDVGAGRRPTIPRVKRPTGTHYVGLDVAAEELRAAPAGAYDEAVVGDAQVSLPALAGRFDLIVSWNVLEHIRHLDRAASVLHEYAKPGGALVACMAGRNAVFAVANRLLPPRIGARLVSRLRRRAVEDVFPAYYDHCTARGLARAFVHWEQLEIVPLWHAADYFDLLPWAQRLYLVYENWAARQALTGLSTHYVVGARKANR
jgi:SAM-dependent methyltransferase